MSIKQTLEERGARYGDFKTHAEITQSLKLIVDVFLEDYRNDDINLVHLEAIDMIFHKIGRIVNGDPNYADNWHDIAGYATLVENYINEGGGGENRI